MYYCEQLFVCVIRSAVPSVPRHAKVTQKIMSQDLQDFSKQNTQAHKQRNFLLLKSAKLIGK